MFQDQWTFQNKTDFVNSLSLIRNLGVRPGFLIETEDVINESLKNLILEQKIDWVIVMGVPVGFGGQLFQYKTLEKISELRAFATENKIRLDIEVDGGLNIDIVSLCKNVGANIFAGWSIIKGKDNEETIQKVRNVNQTLAGELS